MSLWPRAGPAGITGVASIDYSYDENGNLTSRQDATGNTNFTYDELNRMTFEAPEAPSSNTTYVYDKADNLTSIEVSDQPAATTYAYDNLNRATSVVDQLGRQTTFGYNARDLRTSTAYPNGVTQRQVWDDSGRLECIYGHNGAPPVSGENCPAASPDLLTFFSYDYTGPSGLDTTTRYGETNRNNHTTSYTYDDLLRLQRARTVNGSGGEVRDYEYNIDDRGNIARETVTGTTVPNTVTTFAYNDANELCWTAPGTPAGDCTSSPAGATSYGYDDAGNLTTSSDGLSAGYNLQNQTAEVTPPGGELFTMAYADATSDRRTLAGDTRMGYNLLGLASQAPNSGVPHTDWFVRDPNGALISRTDRPSGSSDDSADLFYLFDGLGSVAGVTGPGGNIARRYTYEPYGEEIDPGPADTNPWRYASGYHDTETGMVKFGTRYYRPDIMRWTQKDPVAGKPADPMTLNPYAYVGCDPINSSDPSGRSAIACIAGIAGLSVSAVMDIAGIGGLFSAVLLATPVSIPAVVVGLVASALISTLAAEAVLDSC